MHEIIKERERDPWLDDEDDYEECDLNLMLSSSQDAAVSNGAKCLSEKHVSTRKQQKGLFDEEDGSDADFRNSYFTPKYEPNKSGLCGCCISDKQPKKKW